MQEPISTVYRGYEVYKNGSATQGATELLMLNLLEGFDVKALGHNTADYIHIAIEAAKLAYADREYIGDTDFVTVPFEALLSKAYAQKRRALIDSQKASWELRPGLEAVTTKVSAT